MSHRYEFHKERAKLNRSIRVADKNEGKWQSVGAFGPRELTNFGRLKKSYASVRKSFRLQVTGDKNKGNFDFDSALASTGASSSKINQLGSSAAKLLRQVVAKGVVQRNGADSLEVTNGSFKVLSSMSHYGNLRAEAQRESPKCTRKKSNSELAIELRLRRSKGKVLPSASYQAPDCERACEGLDLDQLEAIKRDNLRQTLRSLNAKDMTKDDDDDGAVKQNHIYSTLSESIADPKMHPLDELLCSCKNLVPDTNDDDLEDTRSLPGERRERNACSCISISSSFSSVHELFDDENYDCFRDGPSDFNEKLATNEDRLSQQIDCDLQSNSSRAQSGFVGEQLRRMFGSLCELGGQDYYIEGDNQREESSNEQHTTVVRVCGPARKSPKLNLTRRGPTPTPAEQSSSRYSPKPQQQVGGAAVVVLKNNNKVATTSGERLMCAAGGEQLSPVSSVKAHGRLGGVTLAQIASLQVSSQSAQFNGGEAANKQQAGRGDELGEDTSSQQPATIIRKAATVDPQASEFKFACLPSTTQTATGRANDGSFSATSDHYGNGGSPDNKISTSTPTHTPKSASSTQHDEQRRVSGSCESATDNTRAQEVNVGAADCPDPGEELDPVKRRASKRQKRREEIMMSLSQADLNMWPQQQRQILLAAKSFAANLNAGDGFRGDQDSLCGRKDNQDQQQHLYSSPFPMDQHYATASEVGGWYDEQAISAKEKQLFDKQLNCGSKQDMRVAGKTPKKSFFRRLKQFINPNTKGQQQVAKCEDEATWKQHQNLKARPISQRPIPPKKAHWQKSMTLTSKSTQNLLSSSLHYLSSSRKSIDLVGLGSSFRRANGSSRNCPENIYVEPHRSFIDGFITLGRRGNRQHHSSNHRYQCAGSPTGKRTGESDETLSHLFNGGRSSAHMMGADRRRLYGSADSLPSADSGLSCSNLQTNSSDENYSPLKRAGCHAEQQDREQVLSASTGHTTGRLIVVGKAKAEVDCNPCAYDKEALVFKQGDIIDILERNESGTWIGHCNGQVGHFKFINVTELDDNGEGKGNKSEERSEGSAYTNRLPTSDEEEDNEDTDDRSSDVYVTKLEIKCREPAKNESTTNRSAVKISGRSLSMAAIGEHERAHLDSLGGQRINKSKHVGKRADYDDSSTMAEQKVDLANPGETFMSSLEQLLFAIGLADEQTVAAPAIGRSLQLSNGETNTTRKPITGSNDQYFRDADHSIMSQQSYLEILHKGGINSLDTFGAIYEQQELERIGILDDEHQRRLLMAAKIIRQASRAAKVEFVENHCSHELVSGRLASDEPIYANLTGTGLNLPDQQHRKTTATSTTNKQSNQRAGQHQAGSRRPSATLNQLTRLPIRIDAEYDDDETIAPARQSNSQFSSHDHRHLSPNQLDWSRAGHHSQLNQEPFIARLSHKSGQQQLNQREHWNSVIRAADQLDDQYHAACQSFPLPGQSAAATRKQPVKVTRRVVEVSPLSRGYSVRVNNNTPYADDSLYTSSQLPAAPLRRSLIVRSCNNKADQQQTLRYRASNRRLELTGHDCCLSPSHQGFNESRPQQQQHYLSSPKFVSIAGGKQQQRYAIEQSSNNNTQVPDLRSHINSSSAYDLRLNLSHFFS